MIVKHKKFSISHLTALLLGLLFYTSIGLLFVLSSVPLRIVVFLLILILADFKKQHYYIIIFSCVIGFFVSPLQDRVKIISNMLSWVGLTGSVIGSLLIYKEIFTGGDFASISRFLKDKNAVAIHAYYVFKLIPIVSDLLDHIIKAFMVYGKRKFMMERKVSKCKIAVDAVDHFFKELLQIMFSQIRVMNRREKVAYLVSQQKRTASLKFLVIQAFIIFIVLVSLIICHTNFVL